MTLVLGAGRGACWGFEEEGAPGMRWVLHPIPSQAALSVLSLQPRLQTHHSRVGCQAGCEHGRHRLAAVPLPAGWVWGEETQL